MSDAQRAEIAKLEALYAEHPEGRLFTHLAEAYRKAGELDRATEVLRTGIDRHPNYSSAHVVLGRVLRDQGQADAAEAEFRRVLELDGQNLVALRTLGDLVGADGRTAEAADYYRRLLDVEPHDHEVRELIAGISGGVAPAPETGIGEGASELAEDPRPAGPARFDGPALEDTLGLNEPSAEEDVAPLEPTGEEGPAAGPAEEPAWLSEVPAEVPTAPQDSAPAGEGLADWQGGERDVAGLEPERTTPLHGDREAAEGDRPEAERTEAERIESERTALERTETERTELERAEAEGTEGTEGTELEPSVVEESEPWSSGSRPPASAWSEPEAPGNEPLIGETPEQEPGEAVARETTEPDVWTPEAPPRPAEPMEPTEPIEPIEPIEPTSWGGAPDPGLATETIAQVYARQGLYDRAADVYRQLLGKRPEDERLRSRLQEMEALAAAAESGAGSPGGAGADAPEAGAGAGTEERGRSSSPDPIDTFTGTGAAAEEPAADWELVDAPDPSVTPGPARVEGLVSSDLSGAGAGVEAVEGLEPEGIGPEPGYQPSEAADEESAGPLAPLPGLEPEAPEAVEEPVHEPEPVDEPEPMHQPEPAHARERVDAAPEAEDVESVWTGAAGATASDETPYAWAEATPEPDDSPPISDYLRGLLGWSGPRPGAGATPEAGATGEEVGGRAAETSAPAAGGDVAASEPDAPTVEPGAADAREASADRPEPGKQGDASSDSEDDDDLDMFRSWLESLKQ